MAARLYMTIGLPHSGKSAYCKKHFPECEHIDSKDFTMVLTAEALQEICEHITKHLKAGKNVVFESTNTRKKTR